MTRAISKSVADPVLRLACAVLLLPTCFAQEATQSPVDPGTPLPKLVLRGLDDPKGAYVIFLNAQGSACGRSLVLPLDDSTYNLRSGDLDVARWVSKQCWCQEPHARMAGLAVLAPDRAVTYIPNQRKRPTRPFSLCRPDAESYVVKMRPRRLVELNVWTPDRRTRHMARDEIVNADWILNKELAGVTLSPTFHNEKDLLLEQSCKDSESNDECCERVSASNFYQPGAINIFYGIGKRNFACPGDVADLVFIREVPVLGDVAHELAHRLGLSQSDNESRGKLYAEGHTTNIAPFDEQNLMWERTQQLKNRLSPGQSFWISQSCTSYLMDGMACLSCSPTEGELSPCPRFSEGFRRAEPETKVCPAPAPTLLTMGDGSPPKGDLPTTVFCSRQDLKTALGQRYSVLKQHRRGRDDLQLGSVTKGDFEDRWMPQFHVPKPQSAGR